MAIRYIIQHRRPGEPVVWIIDSQQWPRACLRAELIERGYDVYGFISFRDALQALTERNSPKAEALIVELRDQNLTKEMLDMMRSWRVPTILLGGIPELNEPLIQEQQWTTILRRPVSLGRIADLVQRFVPQHEQHGIMGAT